MLALKTSLLHLRVFGDEKEEEEEFLKLLKRKTKEIEGSGDNALVFTDTHAHTHADGAAVSKIRGIARAIPLKCV